MLVMLALIKLLTPLTLIAFPLAVAAQESSLQDLGGALAAPPPTTSKVVRPVRPIHQGAKP